MKDRVNMSITNVTHGYKNKYLHNFKQLNDVYKKYKLHYHK